MEDDHIYLDDSPAPAAVHPEPEESQSEYGKFILVIFGVLLFAIALTVIRGWTLRLFLNDFMASFFIVFAGFKFLHIETFALAYRGYDVIAQKFRFWSYIYPFVEAGLGFAYVFSDHAPLLNLFTMVIMGVGAYGVWRTLKIHKHSGHTFHCACLGTFIKLPLSNITYIENLAMFAMAFLMLFI